MKAYQTPEILLNLISAQDVIATSAGNGLFVDGEGKDNNNVMDWWG